MGNTYVLKGKRKGGMFARHPLFRPVRGRTPGLCRKNKKSKSQLGSGLREVLPKSLRDRIKGESPPCNVCCVMYLAANHALSEKIYKREV